MEAASKFLNENALTFLKMQLNHTNKKKKWEDDEKLLALSLYYKSPKAYKFLKQEKKIKFTIFNCNKRVG